MCFSIYFYAIYRSEDEEEYQEDPEDPDFIEGQEEDFAEGKFYHPSWSFWTYHL